MLVESYPASSQRAPQKYTPQTNLKNSTALTTSSLPGGTVSVNLAGVSTGVSIDEEEVYVNGYGKMSKNALRELYKKVNAQVRSLIGKPLKVVELNAKTDLLAVLRKHL